MRDLQNEKRDHSHLPHSHPSEVEGVRIVVISFRNIAKKWEPICGVLRNRQLENEKRTDLAILRIYGWQYYKRIFSIFSLITFNPAKVL